MRIRLAILAPITVIALAMGVAGCAPPIPDGGFSAPDPASRTYALVRLVRSYRGPDATHSGTPPKSELKPVVAMLDSADPMERFMAADALRDLTGQEMGFQPAAPLPVRAAAVERWKSWLQSQPDGFNTHSAGGTAA